MKHTVWAAVAIAWTAAATAGAQELGDAAAAAQGLAQQASQKLAAKETIVAHFQFEYCDWGQGLFGKRCWTERKSVDITYDANPAGTFDRWVAGYEAKKDESELAKQVLSQTLQTFAYPAMLMFEKLSISTQDGRKRDWTFSDWAPNDVTYERIPLEGNKVDYCRKGSGCNVTLSGTPHPDKASLAHKPAP